MLRLEGSVLYLDRYWREERQVCADLLERLDATPPLVDDAWLTASLDRVFSGGGDFAEQRAAVESAVRGTTTVLTGGPGTGKTTTIARLLAVVSEQHELRTGRRPRIAMCAPTAKAAARLQEAVHQQARDLQPDDQQRIGSLEASTLHRLLGWTPNPTRFRQHRGNRLPHDVVVVDETSMVSLTQMARLLEAVRPDARLVLVGDPHQLASIEAGAVLADVVAGLEDHPAQPVAVLRTVHRYGGADRSPRRCAPPGRRGRGHRRAAVRRRSGPADRSVRRVHRRGGRGGRRRPRHGMYRAAESGDAVTALRGARRAPSALRPPRRAVRGARLELCGWSEVLADSTGTSHYTEWYAGRPVLVTANNQTLEVWNGDVGVTMRRPDGRLEVALAAVGGPRPLATTRLPDTETMHATTVHKAQGSQADVVTVVMPPDESGLLTRELFYTAVTRAKQQVRIIGTPSSRCERRSRTRPSSSVRSGRAAAIRLRASRRRTPARGRHLPAGGASSRCCAAAPGSRPG